MTKEVKNKIERLAGGFVIVAREVGMDVAIDMLSLVIELTVEDPTVSQRLAEDALFVQTVTRLIDMPERSDRNDSDELRDSFETVLRQMGIARGMEGLA